MLGLRKEVLRLLLPMSLPSPILRPESGRLLLLLLLSASLSSVAPTFAVPIIQLVNITGSGNATIRDGGNVIDIRMDRYSATGLRSKQLFLFSRVDMQMRLPPDDTSGTITSFYMSSEGNFHDEIDFEFLGNLKGQPYILLTNIFIQGKGEREMMFYLWFDPRTAFHTYTILWNPWFIILYIDGQPIRVFPNLVGFGIPFPTRQPMTVQASIWNADWATQGGRVPINWSHAPYIASYANMSSIPCPATSKNPICKLPSPQSFHGKVPQLDSWTNKTIHILQDKYMAYSYCSDAKRFPKGLPPECSVKF
ncbi:xyloglucan endotransglucosylase/hydrolase 2-like [Nymphaea colorata]|uniref:xyloglucan endotransglucosylase/hydrolase 2-like n=1 Tax=Nymphaea colorata TaxID=210225 RepID=UPI00129DC9A0|nr:xyloglucan endotransglucosylase/hydrolase 2-like [Nymphaea colorata]